MDSLPLVQLEELSFSRGEHTIFDRIHLRVPKGKITAIMGPSGIGKTTLLRLMSGQLLPEKGHVWFDGLRLSKCSRRELFEARKRMGMLFQSGALFTDMSVFDNVAYPLREHTELPESLIKTLVHLKLEAVGLRGAVDLMPSELSGGMARRVALARAIALDPELLMFDEPFAGQDPITMGILVELIQKLNHALNLSIVVVSHDVTEVMNIADYVYVLAEGKILGEGTPEALRQTDDKRIQQFLSGSAKGPLSFEYPVSDLTEAEWN
jgi:phospholipid/cholesterol/gamma-HCH transport system ATP-binding protein